MKKTYALFGTAGALLLGAVVIDLLGGFRFVTSTPTVTPPPPPPPVPAVATGASNLKIGRLVEMEASLSNDFIRSDQPGEIFLRLNLEAKDGLGGERAPMAVALVIDRSGSMQGEKIEKVRAAAKDVVRRLSDRDRITIVSYSTDPTVDLPLVSLNRYDKKAIERIIDGIIDGGGTNLSGGLEQGLDQLAGAPREGFASRLVLLTDGNANMGITEPHAIADIAKAARQRGITVSTLGVGLDFNEDLMTMVASSAGGAYYYAKDADSTARAMATEFASLEKLAARQVSVSLNLGDQITVKDVYGYRTEVQKDALVIPVGDMASGERRHILIHLATRGHPGKIDVAHLSLAYTPANQGASGENFDGVLFAAGTTDAATIQNGEKKDVLETVESELAAQVRAEAVDQFSGGNKTEAIRRLGSQLERTRSQAGALNSPALSKQAEEIESAIKGLVNASSDSDDGRDLVKSEKHRARQIFAY